MASKYDNLTSSLANAKHGRSGASFDWTDEMIGKSGTAIATSGVHHICRACSACHVRARLARAQPPADLASLFLARAQPLLPLPPASQSRQPSRCRACVDATDANSAAHSPGNSRASSIRRRRHLTPRAGQRHQPLTARPNLPFPTLASSASKSSRRTSLLQRMQRQHHVRGRADWRTCMPSHAPHSPPAWIDQLTAPPAPTTACRVMKHDR